MLRVGEKTPTPCVAVVSMPLGSFWGGYRGLWLFVRSSWSFAFKIIVYINQTYVHATTTVTILLKYACALVMW